MKVPSEADVVPTLVPFTIIETPESGVPSFSSVIFPETDFSCAIMCNEHNNSRTTVSSFLMQISFS